MTNHGACYAKTLEHQCAARKTTSSIILYTN